MTTDLKSMTVRKLLASHPGHDDLLHDCVVGDAARELARRLEEAQQKIVVQQAMLKEFASAWTHGRTLADLVEAVNANTFTELTAHDAELTANAKAEALEEAWDRLSMRLGREEYGHAKAAVALDMAEIGTMAAEYRAKAAEAGRKE